MAVTKYKELSFPETREPFRIILRVLEEDIPQDLGQDARERYLKVASIFFFRMGLQRFERGDNYIRTLPGMVNDQSWIIIDCCASELPHGSSPKGLPVHNYRVTERRYLELVLQEATYDTLCMITDEYPWREDKQTRRRKEP
ncbi:uncharacterized protein N7459_005323 [Penicillium hispanicum]|uniref:uncharacterized protein n=1 Tax=Penicillium hispanicum TaxID=1080232 RepID=UPI0025424E80|nr:uncharacterized protein N7459_005323 [Penicillium hispanicum]KAJ5585523.1 hypothetical protein N7459_005323 [Penicillium hispanicum]